MYATTPEPARGARACRRSSPSIAAPAWDRPQQLRRWTDPEDAVQEAFAIFLADYDPEARRRLPWVSLTLRRLCWADGPSGSRRPARRYPDALAAPD